MSARLFLCMILLCASFPLMARDARMLDANGAGGGSCQEHDEDDDARRDPPAVRPTTSKPATHAAKPAKPAGNATHGGGDFDAVRPPRWHSFLPGMFR